MKGTLFLLPVPLAAQAAYQSYTLFYRETINQIREYIVENEKTARKFLKEGGLRIPQSDLILHDYGKHQQDKPLNDFFKGLEAGNSVGLMSEAGCPGVADPGAAIVAEAHRRHIKVVPLVGPSSLLLALMASGFNGQSFTFHGYLPIDKVARAKKIKELETLSQRNNQTQVFIETPFRNNQLLEDLVKSCRNQTSLCVASNLTGHEELIETLFISAWKTRKIDLHKKPTVFILYATN